MVYGVALTAIVFNWVGDGLSAESIRDSQVPSIRIILILIASGIGIGLIRASLRKTRFWLSQKIEWLGRIEPDSQSVWVAINRAQNEDWAIVFLNDVSRIEFLLGE